MDVLWRLSWALPLVLMVGFAAVLILKRFMGPAHAAAQSALRMRLRESLSVSEDTRIHLVEVDGAAVLIVERLR